MGRRGGCLGSERTRGAALLASIASFASFAFSGAALAAEPRNATEPRVMQEAGEVTQVISSFDEGDPFDLNISLGFDYLSKSTKILRETSIFEPGLTTGRYTSHLLNVASYAEKTTRLTPRVDVGVYHNLAVHIALPIILSNSRSLAAIDGSGAKGSPALAGAPGEQLFSLPFSAPTRSGLEYIEAGLDFNIFNQARDRTKPTWLFGFSGRFGVGTPMHACNPKPKNGQVDCADPSDINRDGKAQPDNFEGDKFEKRTAGVTRGTIALEVHTLMSKRLKYIEPYGGFSALFEFPQSKSDYKLTDLDATLVNHPPLVGTMILGMMVIPWEDREKYRRFTIDARMMGQYHSEGRDYSELFDALGSSDASSLRTPQWASYKANPNGGPPASIVDQTSQKTYVTGLTDVHAYGSYRASLSGTVQVGEYVKFQLGFGVRYDQGHIISGDQPCNPGADSKVETAGPCHSDLGAGQLKSTGLPNPNYRPTINAVGRRYYVDGATTLDIFASGVVMF